jgi:hypothetical protein
MANLERISYLIKRVECMVGFVDYFVDTFIKKKSKNPIIPNNTATTNLEPYTTEIRDAIYRDIAKKLYYDWHDLADACKRELDVDIVTQHEATTKRVSELLGSSKTDEPEETATKDQIGDTVTRKPHPDSPKEVDNPPIKSLVDYDDGLDGLDDHLRDTDGPIKSKTRKPSYPDKPNYDLPDE